MLPLSTIFFRLLIAAVLSGLVGIERELRHKEAGLRTNILVGLGSALIMLVSIVFEADQAKIASGVITGIGFLGAGLIIHGQGHIKGVTTAATIWIVSSIGLACGIGYYSAAALATIIALFVLYFFGNEKVREAAKLND
ncbi:MAG: MgtC/SapB family protein [Patescibacteria group bacterium]|nr:MgtC/SapB family protein [Patescibacteria group bacterium]